MKVTVILILIGAVGTIPKSDYGVFISGRREMTIFGKDLHFQEMF